MELKEKAIDIKGKKYVLVSDRVLAFNEMYKNGSIETELLSDWGSELVVVKATVSPDGVRKFTGHAQEKVGDGMVNKTSAMENAETSAVGRALAMMGIGVLDSIASVDEIVKATNHATIQAQTAKKDLGVCPKCGAPNVWSEKSQKPYCSKLCWKQDATKVVTQEQLNNIPF